MRVLAGGAAVIASLAVASGAQAQTVPSVTVPSVDTPLGGTPSVTTPEVQLVPPSGGTPEPEAPAPPSGDTPKPPTPGQGDSGSGSGASSGSDASTQPSSGGGNVRETSDLAGRSAGGAESNGSPSDSGAPASGGKSGGGGSAGADAKGADRRSSDSAGKQDDRGAVQGISESSSAGAKPIRPVAVAADTGEDGPVAVLWLTVFAMLAMSVIVLLRQRAQPLRAAPRGKGPLGWRDPDLPPAPWADWDDGANDRPERVSRRR